MKRSLGVLVDELRRLRSEGVQNIDVSPETVAVLRDLVRAQRGDTVGADDQVEEAAPVAAPPRRAAPAKPAPAPSQPAAPKFPPPPEYALPEGDKATRWAALLAAVANDPVCSQQVRPGKKSVVGVGNLDADIMFCGEAPGAEEEKLGEPFVGPAGELLDKMIAAMGLSRGQVYIGNIMNWRPQIATPPVFDQIGNRPPTTEEMAYCRPYLMAQLAIVQPKIIVAMGATAARGFLGADAFKALGQVRGRWHEFVGVPLMITFHPSYVLRNGTMETKRQIWEDLLQVMAKAELPITAKQQGYFLPKG